jgi:tRNA 2-selenouridine synthase
VIGLLQPLHAKEVIAGWHEMAAAGDFAALAGDLMRRHYDPRYEKHRARRETPRDVPVEAGGLGADELPGLADRVAEAVARVAGRGAG